MALLLGAVLVLARSCQAAQIVGTLAADASADYVIVGGGLAGMVLANRLTASGEHSVIVLEAGPDVRYVDELNNPFEYYDKLAQDGDYSWNWQTVNQTVGGARKIIAGGKALGGSTSINGMSWTRGTRSQYDAIAQLNYDPSFSWDNFLPYMKKAEKFYPPSAEVRAHGAYFDPSAHGYAGDVGASYLNPYNGWQFAEAVTSAAKDTFGLKEGDVAGGDPNVAAQIAISVHPVGNTSVRSSSSNSYLYPLFPAHQNTTPAHPELTVLPGHQATRLIWGAGAGVVADGVEYGAANGTGPRAVVRARKEVLLCAGAIASPAFLQRSGVGASTFLSTLNITPVVNLPSVGTNLQDQALFPLVWALAANVTTPQYQADLAYPSLAQLIGATAAANETAVLLRTAHSRAARIVSAGGHTSVDGLTRQFKIQAQQIAGGAPVAETSTGISAEGIVIGANWLLLPQYRGTVHLASSDPFEYPVVDPAYLTTDFDMSILIAMGREVRRMYASSALAKFVGQEVLPGVQGLPLNASDAGWVQFIAANYNPVYHPIGTVAMLPREDGGGVDTSFRLYGTANVRVVDASVLPVQLSAHLSATLYGIAEKAADTILGGH